MSTELTYALSSSTFTGPEGQACRYELHIKPDPEGRFGTLISGNIYGMGPGIEPVRVTERFVPSEPYEMSGPKDVRLYRLLMDWIERGEL